METVTVFLEKILLNTFAFEFFILQTFTLGYKTFTLGYEAFFPYDMKLFP